MEFTRILKKNMRGDDVLYVKQKLVELGYLFAATHNRFGPDTKKAVEDFQEANDLVADGIVGKLTWAALFGGSADDDEEEDEPQAAVVIPSHISKSIAQKIGVDLAKTTETRRNICLMALEWATDASKPEKIMRGFYIRGNKSYDTSRKPNLMTLAKLQAYFKKEKYKEYYDNGRDELMLAQAEASDYQQIGCDCSGFVSGLWRAAKVKGSGFAATANSLYKSYCVPRCGDPVPGDLAWKDGHIGLYVGGGYVVESVGGEYGIQLTDYKKRKVYSYMDGKLHTFSKWTNIGDPKPYD